MQVIDRVEEKRIYVYICELMYCRDRLINYGNQEGK